MTIREDSVVDYLLSEAGRAQGLKAPNGATYRVSSYRPRGAVADRIAVERDGVKIAGGYNGHAFDSEDGAAIWAEVDGRFGSIGEPIFRRLEVAGSWEMAEVGAVSDVYPFLCTATYGPRPVPRCLLPCGHDPARGHEYGDPAREIAAGRLKVPQGQGGRS